jgi:hypothetical protein
MSLRLPAVAILFCSLHATAAVWPGPAPCDTTLQACIDGTAAAGLVEVASNAVIDESLLVNKPLTLRAAPGYRPVLAVDRVIGGNVNAAGDWSWTVEGFELRRGFVALTVSGGGNVQAAIRRVRVREALAGAAQISLSNPSTSTATLGYDLAQNELDYFWNTSDGALRAALQVLDRGSGTSVGRIRENRIVARGSEAIGALLSTQDRNHTAYVLGNHVRGGNRGSLLLRQGSLVATTGGALRAIVINNVVRSSAPDAGDADGIGVEIHDGSASGLVIWHNTVVDAFRGVDLYADASATSLGASVERNLFASITSRGVDRVGAFTASNAPDRANLFFETSDLPASVGPDSIFADPRLVRSPEDLHLSPASPAVDAADAIELRELLATEALPELDGDGLRRFKRGSAAAGALRVDLGALEYGDISFTHTVPAGAGVTTPIAHPAIDDDATAFPHVTPNWNPDAGPGVYADHAFSAPYGGTRWQLRRENLMPLVAGSDFNLFAPAAGDGHYRHAAAPATIFGPETVLDQPGLNGQPQHIVLATRDPLGGASISDLTSPIALRYLPNQWGVLRVAGGTMPASGGFHIYFQEPSFNAFRHVASAGNILGNTTAIDHALLNDRPCARFHIAQYDGGALNNHHVGVFFHTITRRWGIFNQQAADAMPVGATYFVVIDPAAVDCPVGVFRDGFETP